MPRFAGTFETCKKCASDEVFTKDKCVKVKAGEGCPAGEFAIVKCTAHTAHLPLGVAAHLLLQLFPHVHVCFVEHRGKGGVTRLHGTGVNSLRIRGSRAPMYAHAPL